MNQGVISLGIDPFRQEYPSLSNKQKYAFFIFFTSNVYASVFSLTGVSFFK